MESRGRIGNNGTRATLLQDPGSKDLPNSFFELISRRFLNGNNRRFAGLSTWGMIGMTQSVYQSQRGCQVMLHMANYKG